MTQSPYKDEIWHAKREASIHVALEDGTLPFHNIIASAACYTRTHQALSLNGSDTPAHSTPRCDGQSSSERLEPCQWSPGMQVVRTIRPSQHNVHDPHGPVVNFNLLDRQWRLPEQHRGRKACNYQQHPTPHRRGLCNPGGTSKYLGLSSQDLRQNHAAGHRCGGGERCDQ